MPNAWDDHLFSIEVSILNTLYSILYTLYFLLYTLNFILYTLYFILYTLYFIVNILYFIMIVYTFYLMLYTLYFISYTLYFILYTLYWDDHLFSIKVEVRRMVVERGLCLPTLMGERREESVTTTSQGLTDSASMGTFIDTCEKQTRRSASCPF